MTADRPDERPVIVTDQGDDRARIAPPEPVVDDERYPCEWRCIAFLYARDGLAATCDYCRRTSRIYRSAVLSSHKRGHLRPHFASLPEYRHKFIASYLDFKRFALTCDRRGLTGTSRQPAAARRSQLVAAHRSFSDQRYPTPIT